MNDSLIDLYSNMFNPAITYKPRLAGDDNIIVLKDLSYVSLNDRESKHHEFQYYVIDENCEIKKIQAHHNYERDEEFKYCADTVDTKDDEAASFITMDIGFITDDGINDMVMDLFGGIMTLKKQKISERKG